MVLTIEKESDSLENDELVNLIEEEIGSIEIEGGQVKNVQSFRFKKDVPFPSDIKETLITSMKQAIEALEEKGLTPSANVLKNKVIALEKEIEE